jgi:hypothetical protein
MDTLTNMMVVKRKYLMDNPFTKHPHSVGETYFEHMTCALSYSKNLFKLSFTALVHSIFPFWFETTASDGIKKLNKCLQNRRKGGK